MNHHNNGNGGTPSGDGDEHLDRIKQAKLDEKRAAEEHHKKELEEILKKRDIIKEVVTKDPEDLKPHDINQVLYGAETVDLSLAESIAKKGQLEPIVITQDNIIISGHRRWLALRYINQEKLPLQVRQRDSVMEYDPVELKEKLLAKCVVVHFDSKEDEILAVIDYNKRREKRATQYYNEITTLYRIYNAEKDRKREDETTFRSKLSDYLNVSDLKRDFPDLKKPEGSTEKDIDYYKNLYIEGKIPKSYIIKGKKYKDIKNEEWQRNLSKIATEVGLGPTNAHKLITVGDLANIIQDEKGLKAMQNLDSFEWSINNAYNVARLRNIQIKYPDNTQLCEDIEKELRKAFQILGKDEKPYYITDEIARHFQDIIDEIEKQKKPEAKEKDKFSVILLDPDVANDKIYETYNNSVLETDAQRSALFVVATNENLATCILLLTKKLNYVYRTFYNFGDKLLLLGTKNFVAPKVFTDTIKDRTELYEKIPKYFVEENYHEVPNARTPKTIPKGWEIPVGQKEPRTPKEATQTVSKKQGKKKVKESAPIDKNDYIGDMTNVHGTGMTNPGKHN